VSEPALWRTLVCSDNVEHNTDARIFDGALEAIASYGSQRVTVDDIADAAGVSRMTIFRRFGTKDSVLQRLTARELSRFLADVDARIETITDPAARTAEGFVLCLQLAQQHPWFSRLFRSDQRMLIDVMSNGDPSPLAMGRDFVADALLRYRPGSNDDQSRQRLAELLIRVTLAYALFPSGLVDLTDETQLRAFAEGTIAPLVTGTRPG
jgi:AcrR family transcriptional regulator